MIFVIGPSNWLSIPSHGIEKIIRKKKKKRLKRKKKKEEEAGKEEWSLRYNCVWIYLTKNYYPDPEAAQDAVRNGDAWGMLYFTENFTDALVARMVLGRDADDETLDQSEIRVWLDMSSKFSIESMIRYRSFDRFTWNGIKIVLPPLLLHRFMHGGIHLN